MTGRETRELLESHVKDLFPGEELNYEYWGTFCVSLVTNDLIIEAGGPTSRDSAKYFIMAFNAEPDLVDWVNKITRRYYAIMSSVVEKDNQ